MKTIRALAALALACACASAQNNLRGVTITAGPLDASGATTTKPDRILISDPATCLEGETYYNSNTNIARRCTATNTWSNDGGGGAGVTDGDKGDITVASSGTVWTVDGLSTFIKTLIDDVDASAARTTLGVANFVDKTVANTYTAGAKQTFVPSASTAGITVTCAALPSSPANGDYACDSADSNKVKVRSNGAWIEVATGGGSVTAGTGIVVAGSTVSVDSAVVQLRNMIGLSSSSGTTFAGTMTPPIAAYADMIAYFTPNFTCSGSPTLNLHSLGARNLKESDGTAAMTCTSGERIGVWYDSSLPAWRKLSGGGSGGGGGVTDGDKGDITVSSSGAVWTVDGLTAFAKTLIDDANQAAALATLGLTNFVDKTAANTYTAGAKQTFAASASTAGARVACSALPSTPANGDIACDSADSNKVKVRSNGAWVDLSAAGAAAVWYLSGAGAPTNVASAGPTATYVMPLNGTPHFTNLAGTGARATKFLRGGTLQNAGFAFVGPNQPGDGDLVCTVETSANGSTGWAATSITKTVPAGTSVSSGQLIDYTDVTHTATITAGHFGRWSCVNQSPTVASGSIMAIWGEVQ